MNPRLIRLESARRLVAVADLHACAEALYVTLVDRGLCREVAGGLRWSAAPGTCLAVVGDFIDGPAGAAGTWRVLRGLAMLEREAAQAGSWVIALLGNHETDLLSGQWSLCPGRAQLAHTLGLPGREGLATWSALAAAPEALDLDFPGALATWLASRPMVATIGGVAMVHGGPTPAWLEYLAGDSCVERALHRAIEDQGLGHPLFGSGADSLLAACEPGGTEPPVFAGDPGLVRSFLHGLSCTGPLLVGHNPFLPPVHGIIPLDAGLRHGSGRVRVADLQLPSRRLEVLELEVQ